MSKLIGIILAAIPIVLFLRAVFFVPSKRRSQAVSDLKRQIDYLVWMALILIVCGIVFEIISLIRT